MHHWHTLSPAEVAARLTTDHLPLCLVVSALVLVAAEVEKVWARRGAVRRAALPPVTVAG